MARGRRARDRRILLSSLGVLIALVLPVATAEILATGLTLVEPLDGVWAAPGQPVVLHVSNPPARVEGRLAVFIGANDITGQCSPQRNGDLQCSTGLLRLTDGEQQIVVYVVRSSLLWEEVARLPLKVLTGAGLEVSEFTPRADLNEVSEFTEGRSSDAGAAPRSNFNDLTGQAGLATRWRRTGWEIRSAWNLVGTNVQEQALRYGTRGDAAPNIDLTDYLVELERGGGQLALGHVSWGNQPLLLSGLSHRGLAYRQKLGTRMDMSFTAQSAQILTGYSDMLGITGSDDYIGGISTGFEFLGDRPGGLRLDIMLLNASALSQLDFNTGEVPDAQENTGYDLQLSGSTPGNRLRAATEFAVSRYNNPDDPQLSQGLDLVPVREETSDARRLDVAVDLLQSRAVGGSASATVTLGFQHLRTDPLYRTVGATVTADQDTDAASLDVMVGVFSLQARYSDSEDNVDDLATILKTRSRSTNVSYGLPLKSLLAAPDGSAAPWLPDSFSQGYSHMHQEGINRPPSFDPSTHIPDQVTQNIATSLDWSLGRVNVGYQFNYSDQDNRQAQRSRADFKDISHGVSLGLQLSAALRIGLGLNTTTADDREQTVERNTDFYNVDIDWQIARGFGFRGSYTLTEADDTSDLVESRSWTSLSEINYRFNLATRWADRKVPGQVFLRFASQGNDLTDNVFGLSTYPRNWSFNGGFNVSLF
jgi:hypothetical protein